MLSEDLGPVTEENCTDDFRLPVFLQNPDAKSVCQARFPRKRVEVKVANEADCS